MKNFIFCLFLIMEININCLGAHEGHHHLLDGQVTALESVHPAQDTSTIKQFEGRPQAWTQWIGGFHFIILHFPIALITMTALSELLFAWRRNPLFDYASRFMLIAAALSATPTAVLGLIYSYTAIYEGLLADLVWWHRWLGMATAFFSILTAVMRELMGTRRLYYLSLFILFLLVNITGMIGGEMTFGPYHMSPPTF